jgi:hypothetical protein
MKTSGEPRQLHPKPFSLCAPRLGLSMLAAYLHRASPWTATVTCRAETALTLESVYLEGSEDYDCLAVKQMLDKKPLLVCAIFMQHPIHRIASGLFPP